MAIDPGGVEEPCDGGSSHVAFDSRHGLGLRDLKNYVAPSHTPQAHCVRFGRAVAERSRNTRYRAARYARPERDLPRRIALTSPSARRLSSESASVSDHFKLMISPSRQPLSTSNQLPLMT